MRFGLTISRFHPRSIATRPSQVHRRFASTPAEASEILVMASMPGGRSRDPSEATMITCVIRYHIDPVKKAEFEQYARNWGQAIPRCGADLIGYFTPHEGSTTLAYGIYSIESLAAYEQYKSRLAADPLGRENYEFAKRGGFLLREDRTFLKLASAPHSHWVKP
jgi:hypothetical protein